MSSSNTHSPSASPVNSQHNLMANSTGGGFGSAVGTNAGLRSLNPTWQVWGGATTNTKRNVSGSSSSGAPDSIAEGWTQSRSTSGSWTDDAAHHSPQRKELAQMDSHGSLYSRPRQAPVSGKQQQFSPQRTSGHYDALGYEQSSGRSVSLGSGTKTGAFGSQSLFPVVDDHRNAVQPSGLVENDLVTAMRGMAVEDDSAYRQQRSGAVPVPQQHGTAGSQPHAPHHAHRMSYGGYPSADYASYYNAQSGQVDYNYAYATPDPSLYAMSPALSATTAAPYQSATSPPMHVADPRQAPGVYYDARHASPYYYTHSPLVYRTSAPSPMVAHQAPATLSDKKRELQYHITHNQTVGPMFSSIRPSPAQTAQGYVELAYGSALPMMMPGTPVYAHASLNSPTMSRYPAALRNGRRDGSESGVAVRSPLLEEFRTNKNRKWELRDIFGFVVEFSGDQHGSRFIQQRLESSTPEERQRVFDEIVPTNALHLAQDVFGNYVIQKLFEHGTPVQRSILASTMEGHIHALSLQMYGCRVVQKAVEYITPDQQALFVQELNVHVMKCVKDANGNHVIQKLIERVSPDKLGFVDTFRGSVYELSTHPYGCRVLQRCFEHLPEDKTRPLLDELHKYTANLMQDQFGNYVVQFVLEHGAPHDRDQVVDRLRGQMLNMARHKFASNVCEKALITASPATRAKLIEEILTPKADGVSPVVLMMKDQFANYVLQRAMTVVEGEQKEQLLGKVRPQLNSMRRYSSVYSKHLLAIERLLEKLDKATTPAASAHDPPLTA